MLEEVILHILYSLKHETCRFVFVPYIRDVSCIWHNFLIFRIQSVLCCVVITRCEDCRRISAQPVDFNQLEVSDRKLLLNRFFVYLFNSLFNILITSDVDICVSPVVVNVIKPKAIIFVYSFALYENYTVLNTQSKCI